MSNAKSYLISKDNGKLQIPYADYVALMEKVEEGRNVLRAKTKVLADLQRFLGHSVAEAAVMPHPAKAASKSDPTVAKSAAERVSVEFGSNVPAPATEKKEAQKADVPVEKKPAAPVAESPRKAPKSRTVAEGIEIPPIKKDIADHFNQLDESGRLFNVFKQYYACLNDTCGGTVRVTMKDGFCSLWNYDEWEEFAYVDIFEGHLRIALDPRYTDLLKTLSLCEVPRLLSSRKSLVCAQVDDLNNTMLDVLVQAFEEVGLTAS
jgi:hypothetical protein